MNDKNFENESLKRTFKKDGVVVVKKLLNKKLVLDCKKSIEKFDDYLLPKSLDHAVFDEVEGIEVIKYFQHLQIYIPQFLKLYNSRILNFASFLLEQNVNFSPMGLHNKAPKIGTFTPYHQDNFYSCMTPPDFVTAYVPLVKMTPENGGLIYIRESHLDGVKKHYLSKTKGFSSGIDEKIINFNNMYQPPMEPGDVVFHHGNIIHGAGINNSNKNRLAVAVGVYGQKTKIDKKLKLQYEKLRKKNRSSD